MIEELKLKFGKYKGIQLKDVPDFYFHWCIDNNVIKGKILVYAKGRLNYPKNDYKVTVKDSIGMDGEYFVKAYDDKQAIKICQRQYRIQNTQSFHGTEYSVKKL